MSNMLGLIELLLVLAAAMGWAVFELSSLRRDRKRRDKAARSTTDEPLA